jgi:citrate synthase
VSSGQAAPAPAAARDVVTTTARHTPLHANVDLALVVLPVSSGMSAEAGETVPRTAGWPRDSGSTAIDSSWTAK